MSATSPEAAALIDLIGLEPHPEGGWYKETWRGAPGGDGRAGETAIYFLLDHGQRSHWHAVDATEFWLWHAGYPLQIETAASDEGPIETVTLGPDLTAGEQAQVVIPPGHWQATSAHRGWALVSCIVSPGFEFSGFTLAEPDWAPGA